MQIRKSSVLALFTFAAALTSFAADETFTAYNLDIRYTNSTAQYWTVSGAPTTTGTYFIQIFPDSTSVQTDGAGNIHGTGRLIVTYNPGGMPFSIFYVTYSGRIFSSATVSTTVTMDIRGRGCLVDGSGGQTTVNNTISLRFTGQPGVNPLNKAQTKIVGTLTGTIRGKTPVATTTPIPGIQAVLTGGASSSTFVHINSDVLQNQTHMQLLSASGDGGAGSVKNAAYQFNLRGFDDNRSEIVLVNGFLGAYTNTVGTNDIGFAAPVSAELKGKKKGQIVSGSATPSRTDANLIVVP